MILRLLLIEDNEDDALLVVGELQRAGYEVTWERVDTAAALLAALAQPWDVITCDWVMPQFSAPVALSLLREHHIDAPIVIVSGEVGEEVAASAMWAGAYDFVGKEKLTRLVPAVERALHDAEARHARKRAEDALKDSEQHFRLLDAVFDDSLSCLVLLDRQFNFIRVNAAYARACRREMHEFAGRNHFDLYPSDARAIFEQVVKTKQPFEVIARPFSFPEQPERGVTYWDWTLVPLLDERGEVEFLLFSLHDVTEHVRTAAALRKGEERFRALIERSLDLIAIIDRDGTYRYVNPAHEVASGFQPDELVGTSTFDLLHPDDVRDLAPKLAAAIRTGEKTATVEYRLRHKDGSWRFFEGVALNLIDDPEVAGLLVTGRDVTERKRNEERLRAHALRLDTLHEIYRAILDARSVSEVVGAAMQRIRNLISCELAIVLLFDAEAGVARVVACEPPGALGLEEITLPLGDFSAPPTFLEHPVICIDDIATLTPASSIVRRLCTAGMHSLLTEALISEGELLGLLTLSASQPAAFDVPQQDIAREVADQLAIALDQARLHERLRRHAADLEERVQERTAQIEAANRELATFSYSVSHDLRAPLRAIDGFGRLLLDEYGATLDAEARHYLDRIVAGTERMGQLIEDLLRLSRVAQQEMVRQRVNLSDLARAIAADLRKSEPHRYVEIVIVPGLVATGDAPLLRIALENLLSNAWKYTSKRPTARIEFGTIERDGRLVYFVRDDGAGFDMAYADKLFGAFQRLHGQSEFEGTGIGLATVQRIIHRHGGRIWAESAMDKGATFYFTLSSQ